MTSKYGNHDELLLFVICPYFLSCVGSGGNTNSLTHKKPHPNQYTSRHLQDATVHGALQQFQHYQQLNQLQMLKVNTSNLVSNSDTLRMTTRHNNSTTSNIISIDDHEANEITTEATVVRTPHPNQYTSKNAAKKRYCTYNFILLTTAVTF
jgi:hypothetical protein